MKKVFAMMVLFGAAAIFMAGCGKKEEPAAATSLDSLKKTTEKAATDAKVAGQKAATDASKAADKAATDAKKAVNNATK
jgi:hypothetical protein